MDIYQFQALAMIGGIFIICVALTRSNFRNLGLHFSGFGFRFQLRGKR